MADINHSLGLTRILVGDADSVGGVELVERRRQPELVLSRTESLNEASLWSRPLGGQSAQWSRIGGVTGLLDVPRWRLSPEYGSSLRLVITQPGSAGSGLALVDLSGKSISLTQDDRLGVYSNPRFARVDSGRWHGALTAIESAAGPVDLVLFCPNVDGVLRRCLRREIGVLGRVVDALLLGDGVEQLILVGYRDPALDPGGEDRIGPDGERVEPMRLRLSRIDDKAGVVGESLTLWEDEPVYGWDAQFRNGKMHIFAAGESGSRHIRVDCSAGGLRVLWRRTADEGYELYFPSVLAIDDALFLAALTRRIERSNGTEVRAVETIWPNP